MKRRFKDYDSMNSVNIKHALQAAIRGRGKNDIEDVARLVWLYLFLTLFFATIGNTIRQGYIPFVEDLDRIRDYAWDEAILELLMSTTDRSNSDPKKVSGCSLALQVYTKNTKRYYSYNVIVYLVCKCLNHSYPLQHWLYEHTAIIEPSGQDAFPRFLKQDLGSLNDRIRQVDLSSLNPSTVQSFEMRFFGVFVVVCDSSCNIND